MLKRQAHSPELEGLARNKNVKMGKWLSNPDMIMGWLPWNLTLQSASKLSQEASKVKAKKNFFSVKKDLELKFPNYESRETGGFLKSFISFKCSSHDPAPENSNYPFCVSSSRPLLLVYENHIKCR